MLAYNSTKGAHQLLIGRQIGIDPFAYSHLTQLDADAKPELTVGVGTCILTLLKMAYTNLPRRDVE
jgi:hypothetical protein